MLGTALGGLGLQRSRGEWEKASALCGVCPWEILCTSLNPADVFLGLCSVPLHLFLLLKDFVQHSWRLVVVCSPPVSFSRPLCSARKSTGLCPELTAS